VTPLLSSTGKRWTLDVSREGSHTTFEDPRTFLDRLRAQRGIGQEHGILADLFAPSLMTDAPKAAERIWEAMKGGERIGIFGDYDCDGVTSTAQLVRFFRRHGTEPVVRLPHRVHDGYGLKLQHIDTFYAAGCGLLITVDTGISAADAVRKAREQNIDVIILDHHHLPSALPEAFAILHPQLCDYPSPHPSAAGVVFEFLHTLEGKDWQGHDEDLALAMFGTVADLVPLLGRNRLLVQEGLRTLPQLPQGAIRDLVEAVADDLTAITSTDIAFRIAPRLNAAGRMADPTLALHALLEGGPYLADLEKLNIERQQETKLRWAEALKGFYAPLPELPPMLVAASDAYQPGILGLLAGKLTESFGRPSMAVCIRGNECSASLRSPPCYNIVQGLERCAHLLTTFGGHAQAAGCSFSLSALPLLTELLTQDIASRTQVDDLLPTLTLDGALHQESISLEVCRSIAELGPFGHSNAEPLVLLPNLLLAQPRQVGGDRQHLQAMVGRSKLIGFHLGHFASLANEPIDAVCRLGIDTWNGRMSPQLTLVDLRPASPELSMHNVQYSKNALNIQ
jgi:single-stranded-DNA-specific exonuclease